MYSVTVTPFFVKVVTVVFGAPAQTAQSFGPGCGITWGAPDTMPKRCCIPYGSTARATVAPAGVAASTLTRAATATRTRTRWRRRILLVLEAGAAESTRAMSSLETSGSATRESRTARGSSAQGSSESFAFIACLQVCTQAVESSTHRLLDRH